MSDHLAVGSVRRLLAGSLPPVRVRRTLVHLAQCKTCRERMRSEFGPLLSRGAEMPAAWLDEYDAALDRAATAAMRTHEVLAQERRRAAPVIAAVRAGRLSIERLPGSWVRRVRGIPLVELLLEESWDLRHRNTGGMVKLAELALLAAQRLNRRKYPRTLLNDLHARCWADLGNAYRAADNLDGAWHAMRQAVGLVQHGSGDLLLLGSIAYSLISLLGNQRRYSEADELSRQLYCLYVRLKDPHLAARVLIKLGHFRSSAGKPEEAVRLFAEALPGIDAEREPALLAAAIHNLISTVADAGQYRRARILLWRARMAGALPVDALSRVRLRWVEGRIYQGLGDDDRAECAYREARAGFQAGGLIYPTALVGIDLAILLMEQGCRGEVQELVAEMITTFRSLGVAREAMAALILLRRSCAEARAKQVIYRLRDVAALLKELEQEPISRRLARREE